MLRKQTHKPFDHSTPNSEAINAVAALTEYLADVNEAKHVISELPPTEDIPGGNVEITTLGTGSSLPSKYRNGM